MTAEVKYYLDLDDVLAVRLECSACHVSSSFPLAKLSQSAARVPTLPCGLGHTADR